MSKYNPPAAEPALPDPLQRLFDHPERGRWQAAILLRRVQARWPGWPIEYALAVVDSELRIRQAEFLIMPPVGWEQHETREVSIDLSEKRIINEGLSPRTALKALNAIFGTMLVFTNRTMASYSYQSNLEREAGFQAAWTQAGIFQCLGDCLSISLGDNASIDFRALQPRGGTMAERVAGWAKSYVFAHRARKLFMTAALQIAETEKDAAAARTVSARTIEEVSVLQQIETMLGAPQSAREWYERVRLAEFGNLTAKELVERDEAADLKKYLARFLARAV